MSEKDNQNKPESESIDENLAFTPEEGGVNEADFVPMDDLDEYEDDPLLEPLEHDDDYSLGDDVDEDASLSADAADVMDEDFMDDSAGADFQEFDQFDDFGDDWGQAEGDEDRSAAANASSTNKLTALMENKAIKFGTAGVGGIVGVAILYVFVLGGTIPGLTSSPAPSQQVARNSVTAPQGGNDAGIKQALNGSAAQNASQNEPVSLFDNLDALPVPDALPSAPIVTKDGEDLGDVFSILENDVPSDDMASAPMPSPISSANNENDALSDFAAMDELPMPSPIESVARNGAPSLAAVDALPDMSDQLDNSDSQSSIDASPSVDIMPASSDLGNPFDVFEQSAAGQGDDVLPMPAEIDTQLSEDYSSLPTPSNPVVENNNAPSVSMSVSDTKTDDVMMSKLNEQLVALNGRMDDMSRRMDRIESGSSKSSASSADLSRIENAIERLEKRIERLADQGTTTARNNTASASVSKASAPSASSSANVASAPAKTSAPKKPQISAAKSWELRGASLNNAFIARKNGGALQTVRVGEQVAGLGTVRYIGLEKGSWVVKTSGGTIRQ